LAFNRAERRFGIAMAAMMAMIATTIINSISVKPRSLLAIVSLAGVPRHHRPIVGRA
jgi:hypothetical protein